MTRRTREQLWYLALMAVGTVAGILMSRQHLLPGLIFAVPAGMGLGLLLRPWVEAEVKG
jgi:hypothetical protein